MILGITGNTGKNQLWSPLADLISWMDDRDFTYFLHKNVSKGLIERGLVERERCSARTVPDLAARSDLILSFGGDGTLLNTAHEIGTLGTPILGINIGRLGFLADVEVGHVEDTIVRLQRGEYRIEKRLVLETVVDDGPILKARWAVNEFVLQRSGETGLLAVKVSVDGTHLNTYWADGLIIATPTGSTAYSLSAGGPIMVPGCGAIILTPIAPHTLTVRPIVLPDTAVLDIQVLNEGHPFVFTADGISSLFGKEDLKMTCRRAAHTVNLVKMPEKNYFETLRNKLMWGARKT